MHPFVQLDVPARSVGIHWFGQSSFALKDTAGTILMIDPYFPHDRPAEKFVHSAPPLDEATLRTDYVLLTHDHSDHTHAETLQRIHAAWPKARYTGPVESIGRVRGLGVPEGLLTTVKPREAVTLGNLTVHPVYAKPPGGHPERGIKPPDVTHLGYVIEIGGRRVYISGDPIHTFAECEAVLRPVADLRPEFGMLTTHPTEGEFPFFDGSVQMALRIGLKAAIPAHYACFRKRNYDPQEWAAGFPAAGPQTIIIPYNSCCVYGG